MKRFHFSPKITTVGLILVVGMLCLSRWQWNRHLEKKAIITTLEQRLAKKMLPLAKNYSQILSEPENFVHRKLQATGTYDFEHEIKIKNRRLDDTPGVLVLTPLKVEASNTRILVNRGFIPLTVARSEDKSLYQKNNSAYFIGLAKNSNPRKALAPRDPDTNNEIWHDEFLRIDIAHLAKQFPYPIAPIYLERMSLLDNKVIKSEIVKGDSDKEELLLLPLRAIKEAEKEVAKVNSDYPIPFFTTVLPPGRHLGYVFEWAAMALMTVLVCVVLQLRRPKERQTP